MVIGNLLDRLKGRIRRSGAPANDLRSDRIVFLIECLLNQNARDRGAATRSSVTREVLDVLLENDVGMAQIPCPEMACLGFDRARPAGTSIRSALANPAARQRCELLARQTADRVQDYQIHGFEVLAILGGNRASPGCAVHCVDDKNPQCGLRPESGIFTQALAREFEKRNMLIPFRGMNDADARLLEQDLAWLRSTIVASR